MDISQFNLEYLRLRSGPEALLLSPEDIKKGNGADAKRWIFHNVPYDNFEKQQVRNLETELIERGVSLPQWWREGDSLRYLYSNKFDHEKTIKSIQECLEWKNNPVSRTVSKEVLNLYESGAVYMYGRDKVFRPILVFDFGKVDPDKIKSEDFNAAITILLDLAIHYCHLPGKVEGFIILLDTRNVSVTKLPITPLKNWLAIGGACFPGMTIKTYIVGPPFVLRMSWKLIENVMEKDTAAKIEIISVDEMNKIQTLVDPSQLEEKFGGHLPNLNSFWLPKPTYAPTPSMSRKSLHTLQEIHEVSYEGDPTSQKLKTIPLSGYNIPSVPISMQRVASYQSPHKASYQSPAKSGRAQIFEKTSRTSFGAHSPMRVRDQDENLVNEILNSKARPSAPNFQPRQVLVPPSADTSVHFSEAANTFKSAERVKKAALPVEKEDYNEGSTFYPEPDMSHINVGGDIMSMIIQEDKYLKKRTEPVQVIPDEYNDFEVKITERKTTEAKLKQYVDLSHSPQNRNRMTHNDYMNGKQQSTEKANRYSVDPYKQETQKKSSKPVNSQPEWQYNVSGRFDNSYESYNSASLARRDLNRSLLGELNNNNNNPTDEWNSRKRRELQMPMPQQGMTDESDDDDGNFCGLCVAGRKKDGTKKKTLKK